MSKKYFKKQLLSHFQTSNDYLKKKHLVSFDTPVLLLASCLFRIVIVVMVKSVFYLEIYQNNIFFILKKLFLISVYQNNFKIYKKIFLTKKKFKNFINTMRCSKRLFDRLSRNKNFPVFEILSKSTGCVYSFPQQHAKQNMEHYFGLKKRQTRYVPLTYI